MGSEELKMVQHKVYKLIVTSTINKPTLSEKDLNKITDLLNDNSTHNLIFTIQDRGD